MHRPLLAIILCVTASVAQAEPLIGTWRTEPDRKNLTSHIRVAPCGAALCGMIAAAFDAGGNPVTTPNIGKRLFWDLKPAGGGRYDGGTVWVPLLDIEARAHAQLQGDRLTVTGCKGPVCDGQVWRRVN